eukprot:SAG22_NODE_2360_length_2666_cov_1.181924_2_plen_92_part_00
MIYPGSSKFLKKPPSSDAEEFAPPEQRQIVAPAGSLFMYHAATWHRMHPNQTGRDRLGLLQSFVADFTAAAGAAAGADAAEVSARQKLAGA